MKRKYDITINGEYTFCDLNFLQAYWIAFALFIAGYWRGIKRVRVQSRLVSDVPSTYCIYISNCKQLDICLTKHQANIIVLILRLFGYKSAQKIPF